MAEVYFSSDIEPILERLDFSRIGKNVAVKVHFGERGCKTYISPALVQRVVEFLEEKGRKATLVECNVLYKGSRTNRREHIKTAEEHGFDFAPIDILDGELGEKFIEVSKNIKIGAGLKNYDSLIVLSHFKGHMMAGYGGAIKNMGMGLGSRAGKLYMHSNIKPSINRDRCTACLECINHCDAKAISIVDGKAKIDESKCTGCAMCIGVCSKGAAQVPWHGGSSDDLQKKMAEYCAGVFKIIPRDRITFINVLENITKDCDCMSNSQTPIMEDVGILLSEDIVSIDKASLDLVNEKSENKFSLINSADKEKQIDAAVGVGIGKKEYDLIRLD